MSKLGNKNQQNTHLTAHHFLFSDMLSPFDKIWVQQRFIPFSSSLVSKSLAWPLTLWQLSFQLLHAKNTLHILCMLLSALKEIP